MGRQPGRAGLGGDGDDPRRSRTATRSGEYLLLFDPLDGSSNIDVNVSIGTIFSVLRCPKTPTASTASRTSRRSCSPAAARSPPATRSTARTTVLVLTVGDGVHGFTLDRETRARSCSRTATSAFPTETRGIRDQHVEHAPLGAAGEALHRRMLAGKDGPRGKDFNMRWVASMVADVHRILIARRHLHVPARQAQAGQGRASCA